MSNLNYDRTGKVPASRHSGNNAKTFRLSRDDQKIWGVCGGIAQYMDVDALWVRIGFVAGTLLGFGTLLLVYIAIALIAD